MCRSVVRGALRAVLVKGEVSVAVGREAAVMARAGFWCVELREYGDLLFGKRFPPSMDCV